MRVDRKFLFILVPALFALAPFACGSDEETGDADNGSGGGDASSSTGNPSTVSSSSTGTPTSSSSGMTADCEGILEPGECATCLEANCCAEVEEWGGMGDPTDDLLACVDAECPDECGGGGLNLGDPECGSGATLPSAGACVVVGGDNQCNPVSATECGAAGSACDSNGVGFECFPDGNEHATCEECGANGDFCLQGSTCLQNANAAKCYKFCCTDADCAPGTCETTDLDGAQLFGDAAVGVCVTGGGAGGAGGGP